MLERAADVVICVAVLALAIRLVTERDLFRSIVFFIAMGLMLSIAWVRLHAPDIALAEAAIGAGLTGVLLIRVVQSPARSAVQETITGLGPRLPSLRHIVAVAVTLAFGAAITVAIVRMPTEPGGLTRIAAENLDESGVDNPVTAVLLNFRAYDTWLEIGVLLLAVMGVLAIHRSHSLQQMAGEAASLRVLVWLARAILPLALLIAGYLYWAGTHSPGGAFQAGALAAAALVLMALAGLRGMTGLRVLPMSVLLVLSFAAFLVVAAMTGGSEMLNYRGDAGGAIIIGLELTIVVSTAATLAALFTGAGPRREGMDEPPVSERERPRTL